jgi:YegS/Rv2252/BmrU family lipid kinase
MPFERVHVVINPAAGQDEPVLSVLNTVFRSAGVDYDISITKAAGDAMVQARQAAEGGADVVAAYGGDGTVAEVASGLIGTQVPLAILPGGTANAMSSELNIPQTLQPAVELICADNNIVRKVDMGALFVKSPELGDHWRNFILRVGVGFEAAMVEKADRELKDRFGNFAYLWAAVQNLIQPQVSTYQLVIDGQEIETEGLTCIIANSGNMAQRNLSLIPGIDISDGLLDVIVVQPAGLRLFTDLVGSITGLMNVEADLNGSNGKRAIQWWQAKEVHLVATPAQSVQLDGEVLGTPAVSARILPQAIRVLTPGAPGASNGQAKGGQAKIPAGTQTAPAGTQTAPAGTQTAPAGTQTAPAGVQTAQSLPAGQPIPTANQQPR